MTKLILVALVVMPLNAFAADAALSQPAPAPSAAPAVAPEPAPARESYASALLGVAIGTSSGGTSSFVYSGRVGTSILSDRSGALSLGLVVSHDSSSSSVGTVTADGSITLIMAEIITRKIYGSGLYLGARIGLALESITVHSGIASYSASASSFAVGPTLGYEFPLASGLALDFDFSWIAVSGATLTFPTRGSVQVDGSGAALLQGGLTYRW